MAGMRHISDRTRRDCRDIVFTDPIRFIALTSGAEVFKIYYDIVHWRKSKHLHNVMFDHLFLPNLT